MRKPFMVTLILFGVLVFASSALAATYYVATTGSDSGADGSASPFKTIQKGLSVLVPGDTLVIRDGTYAESLSARMVPSGTSGNVITIQSEPDGGVSLAGSVTLGTTSTKAQYLKFQGFKVTGGFNLYYVNNIFLKNMGLTYNSGGNSVLAIGTNDGGGSLSSSYITIEDSWIWGNARKVFGPLNADHIILRRVIMRNDGCQSSGHYCASNSGNWMSGSTVYNSSQVSMQNVLALDNVVGPSGFNGGADFWTAWHTNAGSHGWGQNEWLGCLSLNSEFGGFETDTDNIGGILTPSVTYTNDVAWNMKGNGFNAQCGDCTNAQGIYSNITVYHTDTGGDAFNMHYSASSRVMNLVVLGAARYGVFSGVAPTYVDNTVSTAYNGASCSAGCKTSNPLTDGSIKYITRIETGSPLKGTGSGGADYGANIIFRYGTDGTFYGESGYNSLSSTALWPWPNEARIKKEMCSDAGVTRGFCAAQTLTKYVWEYLGNPIPPEIYGASATPPSAPGNLRIR